MAETDWKYLQYNVENGQKRTGDGPSGGASSLSDLDDTSISNPSDGQMLGYDGTAGKWKNVAAPAGSVTDVKLDNQSVVDQNGVAQLTTPNIDALGKTDISNPATGEMLGYDGTEGKWKNVSAPGGNVDDVKVNGASVVTNKVANITSYKEVTQAQYEALPDTKLNDGVLYAIKDGGQAVDGFPPLIYSDDEREVGVWRDGRPLYQKSFWVTTNLSSSFSVYHNISDIDFCIGVEGTILYNSGSGLYAEPICTGGEMVSGWGNGILDISRDMFSFQVGQNRISASGLTAVNATIRYVKTTDTPGSGTWTTQGALAHHYSTDEHIVGTWIDGKPVYEKTFIYDNVNISSGQTYSAGLANIKRLIKIEGTIHENAFF